MPEIGSSRLICHARKHAPLLSPFDLPERIAAKLKIVALLVDRKTAVALNQNAVVDAGNQFVGRHAGRSRCEPHIGHPLERHARPRIRVAAAARFRLSDQVRLIANSLIVLEHALLDDRKLGSQNAVVIVLDGREPAIVRAVAEDVDQLAAKREVPEFLRRKKAGARVIRLISQRAVKLGRVADRFVDRQPEMARKQHQIFLPRRHGRRGKVFQYLGANARRVLSEIRFGDRLPPGGLRFHRIASATRNSVLEVHRDRVQQRVHANHVLLNRRAFRRREVLVFRLEPERTERGKDLGILLNAERRRVNQLQLLVHRNGKGIFVELRSPSVAISFDRRKLNRRRLGGGVRLSDSDRFPRDARDLLRGHQG